MDRPALNDNRGGDAVPRDQDGHLRRRRRNPAANKPGMPPHFWDRLNRVHLTRSALREVDRRNKLHPPPQASSSSFPPTLTLDRFARLGGPNLSHLLNVSSSNPFLRSCSSRTYDYSLWPDDHCRQFIWFDTRLSNKLSFPRVNSYMESVVRFIPPLE